MVSKTVSIGIALILIGLMLIYFGSPLIDELALAAGTRYSKTEPLQKVSLITIRPENYSYLSLHPSSDVQSYEGSYLSDGEINFYIMNQENFQNWKRAEPAHLEGYAISGKSYNFTFTPNLKDTLYFVFDNRGSNTMREVVLNLTVTKSVVEASPLVPYAPHMLIVVGLIFIVYGLRSTHRKRRLKLEGVTRTFGIDPTGLSDRELRRKVEEKLKRA